MINELFDLNGKVALVTGGSKGIGRAMAHGLAEAGADIVINSRSRAEMDEAMSYILDGTGRQGHCVVADLFQREDTVRLAREALEAMGRVDIIVNNAGTNIVSPVDRIVDQDWDKLIELNLTAPMVLVRECADQMKERKWGRIVNISSIFGMCTKNERGGYSATKSALSGITRAIARDLAPWRITANAIAPGPISTPLTDRMVQGELREYFNSMLLGRWGTPEDLIGPVLLLSSDAGSFITGTTLTVDGGWMTH